MQAGEARHRLGKDGEATRARHEPRAAAGEEPFAGAQAFLAGEAQRERPAQVP
jgi:hypothetical protein